ncbi:MAG: TadE/TadG family type IV pilus assembly protein [Micromonosporaceae bacterium]|nr:TadE/TadG family type IV pilus assembly protein [Natronosporangium sp.]
MSTPPAGTGRDARHSGGSVSVEVAVLLPAFILLIVLATMVGRLAVATNAVTAAAHDAARAASISRDETTAQERAYAVATDTLAAQGLHCIDLTVDSDTSGFALPVGTPGTVEVTVTCQVSFADIVFAGLPGSRTVSATFVSPIDTWRGRR